MSFQPMNPVAPVMPMVMRFKIYGFRDTPHAKNVDTTQKIARLILDPSMSVQEIIAELPNLGPEEIRLVREKVQELDASVSLPKTAWGRALLEVAGTADDLPPDCSVNHDHYLYGTPKQA